MPKEILIVRNRITLRAAILKQPPTRFFLEIFRLYCSEADVYSHLFSKISPENTGGRVLLLVKLQTGCSE